MLQNQRVLIFAFQRNGMSIGLIPSPLFEVHVVFGTGRMGRTGRTPAMLLYDHAARLDDGGMAGKCLLTVAVRERKIKFCLPRTLP